MPLTIGVTLGGASTAKRLEAIEAAITAIDAQLAEMARQQLRPTGEPFIPPAAQGGPPVAPALAISGSGTT